ncbi:MAG: nitronate monooxygenase [Gammaproteobacteria bacterium]|nr:monooxygenase [Gammaproteobacteria bacterium]MBL14068.1 monooxygenase [Gammaproteobacteria bacterium]MCS5579946.1 nitronate monooxygenase [Gammaproteobacteria bacterium]MEE2607777.1 nitronate monooxygenase [Pseudomonadota bacterium]MEE3171309.1 nitronate monooxygenase [Pseudomonadota bacterium]
MNSLICDLLDIEFPLIAFSHCRDVVVEVSKAGGFGVLGAARYNASTLEAELSWIDEHIDGKPYGVDLIAPTSMAVAEENGATEDLKNRVPQEYFDFASGILERHDIDASDVYANQYESDSFLTKNKATSIIDVAFDHPIKLIANALGVPPAYMIDMGKEKGVATAALIGTREHAIKQVEAGVNIVVASGTEAGGHCGDVSTLVLIPEVSSVLKDSGVPVVAAGGIVTGRQMAACMAMGAAGVWTGSVWLTCAESDTPPVLKEKMLRASSRETVRSRSRTGKHSRQLRSPWTDAWESNTAPEPLSMPLQSQVTENPLAKVTKLAEIGHEGARQLSTSWVGQGVGLMSSTQSAKAIVYDFMQDYLVASERLQASLSD